MLPDAASLAPCYFSGISMSVFTTVNGVIFIQHRLDHTSKHLSVEPLDGFSWHFRTNTKPLPHLTALYAITFSRISPFPASLQLQHLPQLPRTIKRTPLSHKLFSPLIIPLHPYLDDTNLQILTKPPFLPALVPIYFPPEPILWVLIIYLPDYFFPVSSVHYQLCEAKHWDCFCLELVSKSNWHIDAQFKKLGA